MTPQNASQFFTRSFGTEVYKILFCIASRECFVGLATDTFCIMWHYFPPNLLRQGVEAKAKTTKIRNLAKILLGNF